MASRAHIDRFFLTTTVSLAIAGFVIFLSASLGLLARDGASFGAIALKQGISLGIGIVAFYVFSRLKYTILRKSALFILLAAIGVNLLLFIPGLAMEFNGATRWLNLGITSFQPSELLKIAFIIYLGAWIYFARDRIKTFRYSVLPYSILVVLLAVLLMSQNDTDTLAVIAGTGIVMLFMAGMKIRHALIAGALLVAVLGALVVLQPHALKRVTSFFNPSDSQGSSYQIRQSKIAIGSGGTFGRGFGQSIQKFGYLPQSRDDSIFAVAAEEFGFVGMTILLLLYCLFAAAAFRIGTRAQDIFGGMVASGIAILIVTESFMNIAAMMGLLPLFGMPLLFISHGGTALVITLAAAGIVANISKYKK